MQSEFRPPFNWRDHLKVHPAADLFPLMSEAELKEFAEDIRKNGLQQPIVLWSERNGSPTYLLDGRNRLDALEHIGGLLPPSKGSGDPFRLSPGIIVGAARVSRGKAIVKHCSGDPYAIALALNAHRRHLTAEQRRDAIAKRLKANPEQSNRTVAKEVKADDKTVAGVRRDLEANSEIPNKTGRQEKTGRKARGRKPGISKPKPAEPVGATTTAKTEHEPEEVVSGEEYVNLLSEYYKLKDRNSVLTAALNTKEIEAGRTWPPDVNKNQLKKRDRYLESISYFQLELERLYAEVTKQPSWRAEIITKSGERLVNGARFATRGEVDAYANAYALHLSKEGQGKIEVEVIPCENDKPNVQLQGTEVRFAHGDCVLLNWRPAQANEHPAAETSDTSTSPTTGTTAVPPA